MQAAIGPDRFDAALFDMDRVLTTTARMHASAWKRTFDEFLDAWDAAYGAETPRYSIADDYATTVSGKPREDGAQDFLPSRGMELPTPAEEAVRPLLVPGPLRPLPPSPPWLPPGLWPRRGPASAPRRSRSLRRDP